MGIKHFKTAEFDAAVAAAPLAMVRPLQDALSGDRVPGRPVRG